MKEQIKLAKKLGMLMSIPSVDGTISFLVGTNLFNLKTSIIVGLLLIAGPLSWLMISTSDFNLQNRILIGLIAGGIATISVVIAAIVGGSFQSLFNISIIKISTALVLICFAIMVLGIKVPEKVPIVIISLGILGGLVWK